MAPKIVDLIITVSTSITASTQEEYDEKLKELEERLLEENKVELLDIESEETPDGTWFEDLSEEEEDLASLWDNGYDED